VKEKAVQSELTNEALFPSRKYPKNSAQFEKIMKHKEW
jgi:hypothetical protein